MKKKFDKNNINYFTFLGRNKNESTKFNKEQGFEILNESIGFYDCNCSKIII